MIFKARMQNAPNVVTIDCPLLMLHKSVCCFAVRFVNLSHRNVHFLLIIVNYEIWMDKSRFGKILLPKNRFQLGELANFRVTLTDFSCCQLLKVNLERTENIGKEFLFSNSAQKKCIRTIWYHVGNNEFTLSFRMPFETAPTLSSKFSNILINESFDFI